MKQMHDLKQLGPFLSLVQFGTSSESLDNNATGVPHLWSDQRCGTQRFRHSVLLKDLEPGSRIYYRVATISGLSPPKRPEDDIFSPVYNFTVTSTDTLPFRATITIDMGSGSKEVRNNHYSDNRTYDDSIAQIVDDSIQHKHDVILHPGDIAYALDDDCGRMGDAYHNLMQNATAYTPYMLSPGNHEYGRGQTWSVYDERYNAQRFVAGYSDSISPRFYSFNAGLTHWVMLDGNPWMGYDDEVELGMVRPQYNWLQRDLASVDRRATPWVIVLSHYPIYDAADTGNKMGPADVASRNLGAFSVAELLDKYSVDMYHAGHVHHYLRTWPVVNGSVTQKSYRNPRGTVYIVNGVGGAVDTDPFDPKENWEAFRDDYNDCKPFCRRGYGRVTVMNATHLMYQQMTTDSTVIDEITLEK